MEVGRDEGGGGRRREDDGRAGGEALGDIPFELVGKVASAGAVAEAGDVERGSSAARHGAGSDSVGVV